MGIHLEGPFLSVEFKGAMPEELLRKADMELLKEYQEEAEGNIRYITVSPEVEGIPEAVPEMKNWELPLQSDIPEQIMKQL